MQLARDIYCSNCHTLGVMNELVKHQTPAEAENIGIHGGLTPHSVLFLRRHFAAMAVRNFNKWRRSFTELETAKWRDEQLERSWARGCFYAAANALRELGNHVIVEEDR